MLAAGHAAVVSLDVELHLVRREGEEGGYGVRGEVLHVLQGVELVLPHQGVARVRQTERPAAAGLGRGVGGREELLVLVMRQRLEVTVSVVL